jgi:hypothetical protein
LSRILATVVAVVMVFTAACGGDDGSENARATVTVTAEAPATTEPSASTEPAATAATPTEPASPAATTSLDPDTPTSSGPTAQPPSPGVRAYQAGPAGTVTIAQEDGRLRLVSVDPAPGWSHRVAGQEPRRIEVTFRQGDGEVEFEAELEDGGVKVDVGGG